MEYIRSLIRYQVLPDNSSDFDIKLTNNKLIFIPRYPITYRIDDSFQDKLFNAINIGLTPRYTVIRPLTMQVETFNNSDLSRARGISIPLRVGKPHRLICPIDELIDEFKQTGKVPIMDQISWMPQKSPHAIITGVSGSGKSYFMRVMFEVLSSSGEVIAIDPKESDLARLARNNPKINSDSILIPGFGDGIGLNGSFLQRVLDKLREIEKEMYSRQQALYENSRLISTNYKELGLSPIFIFIDEIAALLTGAQKKVREDFQQLLTRLVVLGRESGVYLVLSMQSARAEYINTLVRDSLSLRVQLGRINSENTRFLFPELSEMPMIPLGGKGTGIISINGDDMMAGIEPVATPTIVE